MYQRNFFDRGWLRLVIMALLVTLSLAACIQPIAVPNTAPLKPGDKIGNMVVAQGPESFDLEIPPSVAFCNANPQLTPDLSVAKPGVYTIECSMPPLPKLMIGFGWATLDEQQREENWAAIDTELYVNNLPIDQQTFGWLDAEIPMTGLPDADPNEAVNLPLRVWNVMLENVTAGQLTLRSVWHMNQEAFDGISTYPAGVYDLTYQITVDDSLAVNQETPAPVELVQQATAVFDAFNAAVNAHDVEQALSFFADDAIAQFPNQPPPNVNQGKEEIRAWLEGDVQDNIHVEIENPKTTGNTVSATARIDIDSLPPDLILVGTVEVTVEDGKITSFSYTLDEETLTKLAALESN